MKRFRQLECTGQTVVWPIYRQHAVAWARTPWTKRKHIHRKIPKADRRLTVFGGLHKARYFVHCWKIGHRKPCTDHQALGNTKINDQYVHHTINYGIKYETKDEESSGGLEIFCDSDFAGDAQDRKSATGALISYQRNKSGVDQRSREWWRCPPRKRST